MRRHLSLAILGLALALSSASLAEQKTPVLSPGDGPASAASDSTTTGHACRTFCRWEATGPSASPSEMGLRPSSNPATET